MTFVPRAPDTRGAASDVPLQRAQVSPVLPDSCAGIPVCASSLSAAQPKPEYQQGAFSPVAKVAPAPRPLSAVQMALPVLEATATPSSAPKGFCWRYSFEDFEVGPSNEMAVAASRSICRDMNASDILFLHSAAGLGKTHLIQSVGKELCQGCNRRQPKVEYLTGEEFVSRFFYALKSQETDVFKAKYRNVDLLLLEDVHFLQGKNKMQAELLNTLKALSDRGAKVVFTSSFAVSEMRDMEDQLISRLCSGLLSVIDRPDEETRRRILRRKAKFFQVSLPADVEDVLARSIRSDVRQIESCLRNLALKAQVMQSGITMQMVMDVIGNYAIHAPMLDMDTIINFVCQGFGLSYEQLVSVSRRQDYVSARNTAFFLARKHTDLSLNAIGRRFKRQHSTVLKGITSLEREISRQTPTGRQITHTINMIERNGSLIVPSSSYS